MMSSAERRNRDLRFQLQPVLHAPEPDVKTDAPYVGPVLPASTVTHPKKQPLRYAKYASLMRLYQQSCLSRADIDKLARLLSGSSSVNSESGRHNEDGASSPSSDSSSSDEEPGVGQKQQIVEPFDSDLHEHERGTEKRGKLVLSWADQLCRDDAKVVKVRVPDAANAEESDVNRSHVVTISCAGGGSSQSLNPRIVKPTLGMPLPKSKSHDDKTDETNEVGRLIDLRMKAAPQFQAHQSASMAASPQLRKESSMAWLTRSKSYIEENRRAANAKPSIPLRHTVEDLYFGVRRYGFGSSTANQSTPAHSESMQSKSRTPSHRTATSTGKLRNSSRSALKSSYSMATGISRETTSWNYSNADCVTPTPSRRAESMKVSGIQIGANASVNARSYMNIVHSPILKQPKAGVSSSRATTVMFAE